jgi:flagellar basal-body rod modification protein FlgD
MSTIAPIGAADTAAGAMNVGLQDFLNILLTQLTYQDPLKPMDNQEFMAQIAQFTTLGQTQELNGKLGSLLSTQASMQSIGLIGRTVEFDSTLGRESGVVAGLSWAGETPQLTVRMRDETLRAGINLTQVAVVK